MSQGERVASRIVVWTALVVPFLVIGIATYESYLLIGQFAANYLLRQGRDGPAIAIIVVTVILYFAWFLPYFRILSTLGTNPGLIPFGPDDASPLSYRGGLDEFYNKAAYICVSVDEKLPIWCYTCKNWKPDRTHHCSELGRCVRKMDHFCPWVGGCLGETTYKFFIQFLAYAFLDCLFCLITSAVLVAERKRVTGSIPGQWVVAIVLPAVFGFFCFGMLATHIPMLLANRTTIEVLNKSHVVHWLAIGTGADRVAKNTSPGENVWDLGPLLNCKQVLGDSYVDWFLPIRNSPCLKKDAEGEFVFGPVVQRLRGESGLEEKKPVL
ncbi:zf-DHHC-domain-containing protein [Pseudovirgaria hyperparasitica]|uniref:Palmitoyltransferase n=1 Tax=Pseudovirgaria hyperparasitica TaxID=470096 RepID=A0A6A6W9N1_9PEZI|nr:zf-DHHC-domain-containing protein [Pseudovirgaria hyperparasitica]KAF2758869.1 zf-DHHC-domain-containing protein [Pseudovirgaria hyperparasitica]